MSQTSTGFSDFEKRAGRTVSMKEVRKLLDSCALLPLWPEAGGDILGLSRNAAYAAAQRGDIKTVDMGRLRKVPTAWLRQILGLDEAPELVAPSRSRRRKSR
jgi:hypothetical protein